MRREAVKNQDPVRLTLLLISVAAGGAMILALAVARQSIDHQQAWMMMIALSLFVAPMSTIQIPGIRASVVLGDVVTFTCAILFGPAAAIIAAVADGAISSLRLTKDYKKFIYNVATCAISMAGASMLTRSLFSGFGIQNSRLPLASLLGGVALFTFTYFAISTVLVASYIANSKGVPLLKLWREKFLWTLMSYVASGLSCLAAYLLVGRMGLYIFLALIAVMLLVFICYRFYFHRLHAEMVGQSA